MKMGKGRAYVYTPLAVLLVLAVAGSAHAGLFGIGGRKNKKPAPAKVVRQSLIVFPFDQGGITSIPEEFGEAVASDVRSMLASSPRFAAYLYRDRLAPIRRAYEDSTLKAPDIVGPFAEDKTKALKLAQMLAAELYLVGTIDDYQVDVTKKVAQMTLRGDLYNAKSGKLLKTLLVTAQTPDSVANADEQELRDMAKGAVVTKLVAELTAEPQAEPAAQEKPTEETAAKPGEQPAEAPGTPAK